MTSSAPRPEEERGRILPFQPRGKPRAGGLPHARPDDAPVEGLGKYAHTSESEDYRQRMINNGLALMFCAVLVAVGVWLASTIAEMRRNQDCVLSGRRNCAQVIVPPASPL